MSTTNRPCPECGGTNRFYYVASPRGGGSPFWNCNQCHYKEFTGPSQGRDNAQQPLSEEQSLQVHHAYGAAARYCSNLLFASEGAGARAYLHKRGFSDETIRAAGLGFHPITKAGHGLGKALYNSDRHAYDGARLGGLLAEQGRERALLRGSVTLPYWHGETCDLIRGRRLHSDRYKYLSPGGVPLYAGAAPSFFLHDTLASAGKIILTEGEFKALAAWQAWKAGDLAMPAVAQPGIGYLPEALLDALAGKEVYLVYDVEARADVFRLSPGERYTISNGEKLSGLGAERRLAGLEKALNRAAKAGDKEEADRLQALAASIEEEARAALARQIRVKVVRLPRPADCAKVDLDGFLLEHGAAALQAHLDHAEDFDTWYAAHGPQPYRFDKGGIYQGNKELANYQAIILEDVEQTDGDESSALHRVAVRTPSGALRVVEVPGELWADPRRAMERLRAGIGEGAADDEGRDTFRAIKALSRWGDDPARRTTYTATGWQQIGGRWHYLAPDGAITASGPTSTTASKLPGHAQGNHYALCGDGDAREGARAFLRFLAGEACPQPLALVMVAHAALPLVHRFLGQSSRPTLWIQGETGLHKTSLARIALSLFGPRFTAERADGAPVAKWDSTANGLEAMAYQYRDALYLVDDYKAATATRGVAAVFLHNHSEGTGRQRMNRDRQQDRSFPGRGILMATGEDIPSGDGGQVGRILPFELKQGAVDRGALQDLQRAGAAGHLAAFWREFVQHLAAQLDHQGAAKFGEALAAALRADDEALPGHARAVGDLRQNRLAWLVLRDWLQRAGHITATGARELDTAHLEARRLMAETQARASEAERPALIVLSILQEMLATGEAVLDPAARPHLGEGVLPFIHPDAVIGFERDDGTIALYPEIAMKKAKDHRRAIGQPIHYTNAAVYAQLANAGTLAEAGKDRPTKTTRHPVTGNVVRVLLLRREALFPEECDSVTAVTAHELGQGTSGYKEKQAETEAKNGFVTAVTAVTAVFVDTHEGGSPAPSCPPSSRDNSITSRNAVTAVTSGYNSRNGSEKQAKNGSHELVTSPVTNSRTAVTAVTDNAKADEARARSIRQELARASSAEDCRGLRDWAGMVTDARLQRALLQEIAAHEQRQGKGAA